MEIGICTFGDVCTRPVSKEIIEPYQRLKNLLEEIEMSGSSVVRPGRDHRRKRIIY